MRVTMYVHYSYCVSSLQFLLFRHQKFIVNAIIVIVCLHSFMNGTSHLRRIRSCNLGTFVYILLVQCGRSSCFSSIDMFTSNGVKTFSVLKSVDQRSA